jgi:hypothetical protein
MDAESFFALDASVVVAVRAKPVKPGALGPGTVLALPVIAAFARSREVVAPARVRAVIQTDLLGATQPANLEVRRHAALAELSSVACVAETGARTAIAVSVLFAAAVVGGIVAEGPDHAGTGEQPILSHAVAEQDGRGVTMIYSGAVRGGVGILDVLHETSFVGYEWLVFIFAPLDAISMCRRRDGKKQHGDE